MSENQQPLTEKPTESVQPTPEETAAVPAETEPESAAVPAAAEDDTLAPADDSTEEPEEEKEEDIDPADVKIFGMPRVVFHFTAFGVAVGYIAAGLLGVAGLNPPNATICAVVCAAIGYFFGKQLYKKRKAERDGAQADAEKPAE